ncbi:MAG: hypothetical protein HKP37_05315 [Boseongicola sp.]|nr:hypothetical protein [Boseongicola sp.]NNL18143.1 hypothetical protein [Boseongicola sp.]
MKYLIPSALTALALVSAPTDTFAAGKGAKNCPPGLAKKTPACVPPGLAKKGGYAIGDHVYDPDYVILRNGDRVIFEGREYTVVDTTSGTILRRGNDSYRLPRDRSSDYVRIGDNLIKVDRQTKEVIELIRLADLILG